MTTKYMLFRGRDTSRESLLLIFERNDVTLSTVSMTRTIDPSTTMAELLQEYPGAQRALFRAYHIGGCASCGFSPDATVGGGCGRNGRLAVEGVVETILEGDRG